jgi:hypothetical protein
MPTTSRNSLLRERKFPAQGTEISLLRERKFPVRSGREFGRNRLKWRAFFTRKPRLEADIFEIP